MKLSYNWLKDYLKCSLNPQQIAEAMTSIGIEVDGVEEKEAVEGGLANVVVAQVLTCGAHPDSDHLHVTTVNDGSPEPVQVVCGAPNVAAGQKVLFAQLGAVLPGDFKIKKSKIRGIESFGMICAEDELGIGTSHEGIMVLPDDAVVGTPAKDYLHLETSAVIEYEITANRVDAASVWGVARDLYAYLKLNDIPCELVSPIGGTDPLSDGWKDFSAASSWIESNYAGRYADGAKAAEVTVLDNAGAPRYGGISISGVKVAPSPEWLQNKLMSIGLKPINNIVDISNFVLFELGQPLHTFDADKISGGKVIVRRAADKEQIRTLDGEQRELAACDMVIADAAGPMCIAGVFGGEESGVTDSTVNVFVECAYFNPASIRKTSKSQGLQTDASFRYERGCDPQIVPFALCRAVQLILECAGGSLAGGPVEVYPEEIGRTEIDLDYDRIDEFVGQKIGAETIEKILGALNYRFVERDGNKVRVAAPTYMVDVTRECDVVEEVLRIYGYDNIALPKHMKMSVNATPCPEPEAIRNHISNFLASNGFVEIMNNSLTKAEYYDKLVTFPSDHCVRIVNPLSQDLNVMRQSLIPGALEVVAYNINRQISSLKMFEYGSVYQRLPEKTGETLEGYEEHQCFCLVMSGTKEKSWKTPSPKTDYFQLKGYLELLFKRYGADLYQMWTDAAPADIYSEGVVYKLPGQGKVVATIGVINSALARRFGIRQQVVAAEINWQTLFDLVKRDKVAFRELPKFPEVRRDLALLLDEAVSYADLRVSAFKQTKKLLKSVSLFDVYRGDKIPEGKKQYALSFTLQDPEKTLTDQDVERAMTKILETYKNQFGALLR